MWTPTDIENVIRFRTNNKVLIWPTAFLSAVENPIVSVLDSSRSDIDLNLGMTNDFTTSGPNSQRPAIAPYNDASGV